MDGIEAYNNQQPENIVLARKHWVVYVYVVIRSLFVFIISALIVIFTHEEYFDISLFWMLPWPMYVLIMGILNNRSVVLFMNREGIWVFSGVFPWSRGVLQGVLWENVDTAAYGASFFSWLLRSRTIGVYNRFTQGMEIHLTNMADAELAVGDINGTLVQHRESGRGRTG